MTTIVIPYRDQRDNIFDYHLPGGRTIFVCKDLPLNTKSILSEFCPILGLPKTASKDRIITALSPALVYETTPAHAQLDATEDNELVVSEHSSDYSEGDEEELEAERAYEEEWNEWLEETIREQNRQDSDATELSDDDGWLSPRVVVPPTNTMNIVEETNKSTKIVLRLRKNGNNEIIHDKPKLFVMKLCKYIDNEYKEFRMGEYLTEMEAVKAALRKLTPSGIFELTQRQKNKQQLGPEWVHLEKSLHNIKEDTEIATHLAKYITTLAQLQEYLSYKDMLVDTNQRAPFAEKYGKSGEAYSWYFTCNGKII